MKQNDIAIINKDVVPQAFHEKVIEKTPDKYIKTRVGRGNIQVQYVEGGYIIAKLNELFNYLWDFEIVSEKVGKTEAIVQGKLTVYLSPTLKISKTQYGGAPIKKSREGQIVDYGDDLKAAATDALKKCASMFGISQDVYWKSWEGNNDTHPDTEIKEPQESFNMNTATDKQKSFIYGLINKKGKDEAWLHAFIKEHFQIDSMTKLSLVDAKVVIDTLLAEKDTEKTEGGDPTDPPF